MGNIKIYLTSKKRPYIWIGILSTIVIVGVIVLTVSVVYIANGFVASKSADNSNGPFSDKQSGIDNNQIDIGTPENNRTDKARRYNLTHSVAPRPRASDAPTNIKAEVINSSCMRLTWHAPSLEKMRGVVRGYLQFFQEIDATGATVEHEKIYRTFKSVRDCELIVNDLKSNTNYAIQVSVWYGRHGNGEMSTKIYAKTPATTRYRMPAVGFTAKLSRGNINPGNGQTIKYDEVVTNHGDGYQKKSGHFVAPYTGLYMISCTMMSMFKNDVSVGIVKNGNIISTVYSNRNSYDSSTQTLILDLKEDDEIWIKRTNYHGGTIHENLGYNIFSGALLALT